MMATTHGFVALVVAVWLFRWLPGEVSAPLVFAAAFAGGVAPDLDLLADHRRTLHFPVAGTVLTALCGLAVVATGSVPVLIVTAFVGGAALHAASDVLGGSAESEPWNPTTERGVYDHVTGVWRRPRRLVRYSGAPEDFLLGVPFAAAAVVAPATGPTADAVVVAALFFSAGYALVRKRLVAVSRRVWRVVPGPLTRVLLWPAGRVFPGVETANTVEEGGPDRAAPPDT